ncbi:serine hydrolase domain-containing protein [Microbacterium radiodurans]|uniref:Beta-lactamase family protein n=1 Tax=Microbacterium radiodurans TaxID=661398 RepID=A0A5J5IRE1_9MICO|nr:serine hydrolase domain-containing protein [Microbacterium radiodurans]KAA9087216.1 beta-lactamase family protein [Microbacterium radiodurans]
MSSTTTIALDPQSIRSAVDEAPFTGVIRVDAGAASLWRSEHGLADRASEVPVAAFTRFAIASGSKAFTALAVMRLVESGDLSLDTTARSVLGADLPLVDDAVTVEQLLGHTSGIGDYIDEDDDLDVSEFFLAAPVHTLTSAEAFLPLLDGIPAKAAPGDGFAYCNSGYVLLAIIVERVTGRGYHEVVQELVLDPAGLTETGFPRTDELGADHARGYVFDEGLRVNTLHLPVRANGDGGASTTASDVHRFWQALFAGRIVSTETVARMVEPRSHDEDEGMRYGLGFWLNETGTGVVLEGCDVGASFRSVHHPGTATTATVMSSTADGAWPVARVLANAVAALDPA